MDAKAAEALEKSIKHWEDNAGDDPKKWSVGASKCALCDLYYEDFCRGCPVRMRTGITNCAGTPYRKAVRLLSYYHISGYCLVEASDAATAFRAAARAELDFLISLREPSGR